MTQNSIVQKKQQHVTAFVFAGGGSFGAIQVGMLQALVAHGVRADIVVGSSVGAMNGAYYAGSPNEQGVNHLAQVWRGIRRNDIFPVTLRMLFGFILRRDFLITHHGVRRVVESNLPYKNLEDAKLPVYIVTTDILSGDTVVLSRGSAADAIVATTAIPGVFAPVANDGLFLSDGAISSNTPIRVALLQGATRLIILPTGYACAHQRPPVGAVANALHALTLLISRQLTTELEFIDPRIEYHVVPPLCPLIGSPYDFSRTDELMSRAFQTTKKWIADGGLEKTGVPMQMLPHKHPPARLMREHSAWGVDALSR